MYDLMKLRAMAASYRMEARQGAMNLPPRYAIAAIAMTHADPVAAYARLVRA
jgi:hypothetical protein